MQKIIQPNLCPYYSPAFKVIPEYITLQPGECMDLNNRPSSHLLYIVSGSVTIDLNEYSNCRIKKEELFFLPKNTNIKCQASTDDLNTSIVLMGYNALAFPCTSAKNGLLYHIKDQQEFACRGTIAKEEVSIIFTQIIHYIKSGINCHHLFFLKQKELYLVFKHFYTYEEITQLFYLSLGADPLFTDLVLENYLKVKTAQELASLLGYGIKTFEKLFKENFNNTPYQWIQEQKAIKIKQKLINPSIPLKQIMYEFKFATSSHFNFYCKHYFGGTPIQIRNNHKNTIIKK